jgi:hypothetical protein
MRGYIRSWKRRPAVAADCRRPRRVHRFFRSREAGCSRYRRGNDSAHTDRCISIDELPSWLLVIGYQLFERA